jgi:hypothetical protein
MLWAAGVLATNSHARVPGWDLNPFVAWTGESSLTPGQSLIAIGIAIIASAVLWLRNRSGGDVCAVLFVVGGVAVLAHGILLVPDVAGNGADPPRGDLGSLVTGSAWFAGLCAAWAIATSRHRQSVFRLTLATVAALLCIIAAKALFERFVEYPRMIATYRADPPGSLLAQGMEPGSARALAYERRILGGEPTGWFGLSNVLASFMAFGLIVSVGLSSVAWQAHRRGGLSSGAAGAAALFALGFGTVLFLTGSSAAIGLSGFTLAALGALACTERGRRVFRGRPRVVLIVPSVLVLLLVLGRGMLLAEGAERSVLFRWHYWIGTLRAWSEQLVFGAGPGGFQAAYTRLKPAISPENVQTPHALPADWLGALGMFGLVWLIGLGFWIARIRVLDQVGSASPDTRSDGIRSVPFAVGVSAAVFLSAAWVQWPIWSISPDLVVALSIGLIIGAACAWLVTACLGHDERNVRVGVLAGVSLLLAHGMFDVAPARLGSAWLFWIALGLALPSSIRGCPKWGRPVAAGVALIGVLILGVGISQSHRVESRVIEAARAAGQLARSTDPAVAMRLTGEAESGLRGATERAWPSWMDAELQYLTMRASISGLPAAGALGGRDLPSLATAVGDRWGNSIAAQSRVTAVLGASPPSSPLQQLAAEAAVRAAELAPHDAGPAYAAFEQLTRAGRRDQAKQWAESALRNARQSVMDPLAGLTDAQIRHITREFPSLVGVGFSDAAAEPGGVPSSDRPTQ